VRLLDDDDFTRHTNLVRGYIGPHAAGVSVVVADPSVRRPTGWVTGANRVDHHVRDAWLGRDFEVPETGWVDLVSVRTGDACPRCAGTLSVDRGIEVGHVFQLGTKYAQALDAGYVDEGGVEHPMLMGCYGIGISRVVAAVVEQHHDEHGISWPVALAPHDVHLVALGGRGETAAVVLEEADRIHDALTAAGLSVLYDDRDASPGVKFADADLLGVPVQLIVGAKGLARGVVERKVRATGERDEVPTADVVAALTAVPA
jgi:prolyl-tRNA synthetase